jgi:hypothetical protein
VRNRDAGAVRAPVRGRIRSGGAGPSRVYPDDSFVANAIVSSASSARAKQSSAAGAHRRLRTSEGHAALTGPSRRTSRPVPTHTFGIGASPSASPFRPTGQRSKRSRWLLGHESDSAGALAARHESGDRQAPSRPQRDVRGFCPGLFTVVPALQELAGSRSVNRAPPVGKGRT